MEFNLEKKRVLVTGSSRGIGFAIAKDFLSEGARVVIASRNQNELEQARTELGNEFSADMVLAYPCDFRITEQIRTLTSYILQSWGGLDILLANVGSGKSVTDTIPEKEHFDAVFSQNFDVAVNAARELMPLLKDSKGNMLFISSIAGMEAFGAPVDYSVAKTAVISFAKNLARKVAKDGVRVNCISPGNVFFEGGNWDERIKTNPVQIKLLLETTVPMNRFGTPEEIADAAGFLCSERAAFITGSVLVIDGGQTVGVF